MPTTTQKSLLMPYQLAPAREIHVQLAWRRRRHRPPGYIGRVRIQSRTATVTASLSAVPYRTLAFHAMGVSA